MDLVNDETCSIECDFSGTKLCYSKINGNPYCNYPKTYYDCTYCKENSTFNTDICYCNKGFIGIGYIECIKDESQGKYFYFRPYFYLNY